MGSTTKLSSLSSLSSTLFSKASQDFKPTPALPLEIQN